MTTQENFENIAYTLTDEDAERFREYKRRHNIRRNAEAARKALFDQMDAEEAAIQKVSAA